MRDSMDDKVDLWARQMPGLDPLKEQIIGRIMVLNRAVSTGRSVALDDNRLALWQFKTLLMLRRQGPPYELAPSALADNLGLTRGALSARLADLESRGLIERHHDTVDRRRVTVRLTKAGHRAVESQLGREDTAEQAILAPLNDKEKHQLANLLRKLTVEIESLRGVVHHGSVMRQ